MQFTTDQDSTILTLYSDGGLIRNINFTMNKKITLFQNIVYTIFFSVFASSDIGSISFRLRVVESNSSSGNFSVLSNVEKFVEKIVDLPCFDFKPEPGQGVEDVSIECATCNHQLSRVILNVIL